jgi:hypothetical protein
MNNANRIINTYAGLADYDKLVAFKNDICGLVSYNSSITPSTPYGNPWQIIWVFDGNPATNVVAEGYARAFQYLCDKSSFRSSRIFVLTVNGSVSFGPGVGGSFIWNVVHMDNNCNYIVDLPNYDQGHGTFMKGAS